MLFYECAKIDGIDQNVKIIGHPPGCVFNAGRERVATSVQDHRGLPCSDRIAVFVDSRMRWDVDQKLWIWFYGVANTVKTVSDLR